MPPTASQRSQALLRLRKVLRVATSAKSTQGCGGWEMHFKGVLRLNISVNRGEIWEIQGTYGKYEAFHGRGGTPNGWLISWKIMENPNRSKWMMTGGTPMSGNHHISENPQNH